MYKIGSRVVVGNMDFFSTTFVSKPDLAWVGAHEGEFARVFQIRLSPYRGGGGRLVDYALLISPGPPVWLPGIMASFVEEPPKITLRKKGEMKVIWKLSDASREIIIGRAMGTDGTLGLVPEVERLSLYTYNWVGATESGVLVAESEDAIAPTFKSWDIWEKIQVQPYK